METLNPIDWIIIVGIVVLALVAIKRWASGQKKGACGCGCSTCAHCPHGAKAHCSHKQKSEKA